MDAYLILNAFALSAPLAWLGLLVFGGLIVGPAWAALRRPRRVCRSAKAARAVRPRRGGDVAACPRLATTAEQSC
jgi:hypothetical protein